MFSGCSRLEEVTIPAGVTNIAFGAFWNCGNLASMIIPNGVTYIGGRAFEGCSSIESVSMPNSITGMDYAVFKGCSSLRRVTLPQFICSSKTNLRQVFVDCYSSISEVLIAEGVREISAGLFDECSSLQYDMTTIRGVKMLDGWVVGYNNLLSGSVNLSGIRGLAASAFNGCTSLTEATIGNGITSVPDNAFSDCSHLSNVVIPNSVTNIGDWAFSRCGGLTDINRISS